MANGRRRLGQSVMPVQRRESPRMRLGHPTRSRSSLFFLDPRHLGGATCLASDTPIETEDQPMEAQRVFFYEE